MPVDAKSISEEFSLGAILRDAEYISFNKFAGCQLENF